MSRRSRRVYVSLCIFLLLVIVWLDYQFGVKPVESLPTARIKSEDFAKYHNGNFRVSRVIDGDTIDIDIPDGKFNSTRIRLLGVDTPETKDSRFGKMYFGPEATLFTKEQTVGKNIVVLLDKISPTRDKYNRLLAYIKLPDGKILNEILITQGFAYADLRFKHSFYKQYCRLESVARQNKKGLWKNVTRDRLPRWLGRMRPELLNN